MCEFCAEHKRKKWFLDPENFREILQEEGKRPNVLQKLGSNIDHYLSNIDKLDAHELEELIKEEHACQIITPEDAKEIIDLGESHVLLECPCRKLTGNIEKMCCVSFGPMKHLVNPWEKMEEVDSEELKLKIEDWYNEGLYLSVGYAVPPYPLFLCSCERKYCLASKVRFSFDIKNALLKGHEVARVDTKKCKCETFICITKCPFGAMFVDRTNMKAVVDPTKCFGCGLCTTGCKNSAIDLVPRETVPGARTEW